MFEFCLPRQLLSEIAALATVCNCNECNKCTWMHCIRRNNISMLIPPQLLVLGDGDHPRHQPGLKLVVWNWTHFPLPPSSSPPPPPLHRFHWKWEIKEFAKMTTSPPIFGRYELFQIEYLDTTVGQFHFLAYIWSELIIQRRQTFLIALFSWSSSRLAEGCEKVRGPVEQTLR